MFGSTLGLAALVAFWCMLAMFIAALSRRKNSIADIAWGPVLLATLLAALWWNQPAGPRPVLVTVLVAIWAVRLAVHIALRSWGKSEDWRYAAWRQKWGRWFALRTFLQVFALQGFLLVVVALPGLWVNTYSGPKLGWLDAIGVGVWLLGFIFEVVADHQLVAFQRSSANKEHILRSGLWRYSRHPNYFGEAAQWWGLWLIALSVQGGWWTVLGPVTITFLLLRVSGVPLLESKQKENPEFRDYMRHTSGFVPWFPKKKTG